MNIELSDEQVAIRDMARSFARAEIAPHALEWDEKKHFPIGVLRKTAALSMGGVYVREDVGGAGMTRLDAALIFETLAQGCLSISAYISIHNMCVWMVDSFGSSQQRARWLPGLCSMQLLASYCLIEPGAIIDKDNNPQWRPAHLEQVSDADVDTHFAGLGSDELDLSAVEHGCGFSGEG